MSEEYRVICECNTTLVVRDDMLGQTGKCPRCGLTIPISAQLLDRLRASG